MELDNNNYEEFFLNSSNYNKKLTDIDNGVNVILGEYKKIFVIAKMNATNQEYQQQYQSIINGLDNIMSNLFTISNDVEINTNKLNEKLFQLDILINREREKNKKLKMELGIVENKANAAYEMNRDYKDIYDNKYLRNWSLLLCSVIGIIAIKSVYKK